MTKRFQIRELEEVIRPYDLIDTLNSLLDNNKISGYYYDFDRGEVELEIPETVVIEELFNMDRLNPQGETH